MSESLNVSGKDNVRLMNVSVGGSVIAFVLWASMAIFYRPPWWTVAAAFFFIAMMTVTFVSFRRRRHL